MGKEQSFREIKKGKQSGNCVEIPLPELADDSFEKGRVFQYGLARWAYGFLLFIAVGCVLTAVTEIPNGFFLLWGVLLLPTVALFLLAKYEIRHDRDGFSICLGKKVIRRYTWDDVTAVNEQKQVFIHGKKQWLIEPSMSGYEGFYARARAACKGKGKPKPASQTEKNTPKPTEQQEESPKSKGYIELDLSRLKDKLDDGYERLVFGTKSRKFDGSYKKDVGRLGLDPIYGKAGIFITILMGTVCVLCAVFRADLGLILFMAFTLLLSLVLAVIGKYEIRFDKDGFSTRFGKRILREYKWSDVTDVQDGKKVYVNGKRLLTDHTFDEFPEFYKIARAACKGKGKPIPPSEKKSQSRKKNKP